jgi:hypothetical protein
MRPHHSILLALALLAQIENESQREKTTVTKVGPEVLLRVPPRPVARQLVEAARVMKWPERAGSEDGRLVREIRITDNDGQVSEWHVPLLRLVDSGNGFEAQLFVWWRRQPELLPESGPGATCGNICVQSVQALAERDWNDIGTRLLALTACRSPLSGVGTDNGDLYVDLFDRGVSRTYWCNAPRSAPDADVRELYQVLWDRELWGTSIGIQRLAR